MTNATKANLIALVNASMGLLIAFDVAFTSTQQGAILLFSNVLFGTFVGVTFKWSPKRVPEGTGTVEIVDGEVV